MTAIDHSGAGFARPRTPVAASFRIVGAALVAFGVFLSGFVINEPAPYELFLVGLIGLWALFGIRLSRAVMPLIVLILLFNVGGMIALTQMGELADTPI